MKCPSCGASTLVHETRDLPYTYKGLSTVIRGVEGDYCGVCEEMGLSREAGDRYGAHLRDFQMKVNAEQVDPSYIKRVRTKLNLNQSEAGEIFGGGVNAFSRYETGKAQPPVSLVKLLYVLERHPDLLNEVREFRAVS